MKFRHLYFVFTLTLCSLQSLVYAQQAQKTTDAEDRAKKSMMQGDFREVVVQLRPLVDRDSTRTDALWMLGYSYFQLGSLKEAINTFNRLIVVNPKDVNAYYYKAKSQFSLSEKYAWNAGKIKEDMMLDAISNYTRAVDMSPADAKYLVSRGLAYMDYGIFKSQKFDETYNRRIASNSLKRAIKDFKEVLSLQPSRQDIQPLIDKARGYLQDMK